MGESQVIDRLKRYGFAKGNGRILTPDELIELESIVDKLHSSVDIEKDYCANAPVVVNLVNQDDRLDSLLEKILTNADVKRVLKSILGDGYKLWQINSRYSQGDDKGLDLHQDALGQTNFWFMINNQEEAEGVTAFLSKSHLFFRWAKYVSWSNIRIARYWLTPLTGQAGEHAFFLNKTWHARLPSTSARTRKAIGMGFFPAAVKFEPSPLRNPTKPIYQPELRRLLVVEDDAQFCNFKNQQVPYAMEIERVSAACRASVALYAKVLLLEAVFRPIRFIYRLLGRRGTLQHVG